jgi:acyl transferase domain-containing protein/acyl-CoA synthetase (AMP-forming)/AMP-acid ligase II/acyl carrier protein
VKPVTPSSEFKSLVEAVRFRAVNTPDETALIFLDNGERESLRLTFRQIDKRARSIALQLTAMTEPGERALLLYPSSVEFPCAFLGCLYAGVVAVPAYPPRRNRSVDRLQAIIADAGARVALTTRSTLDALQGRGLLRAEGLQFVATDEENGLEADSWNPPSIETGTLAFLQYTSGSTGLPKGVMVSHSNIIANVDVIRAATAGARLHDGLIVASWLPLFHDMGLIGSLMWPLIEGGTLISMEPAAFIQKPVRWLQAISKYRVNLAPAPNSGYDLCLRKVTAQQKEGLDLSCWQAAFNGSEPLRRETIEGFAAAFQSCGFRLETMYPCYGLAEATLFVTGGIVGHKPVQASFDNLALERREVLAATSDEAATVKVGCGRAWSGHTIRIVDPETRQACRENQIGEIWVSGASVAQGYWNRPELSEATFRARIEGEDDEAFLRTGDLGFLKGGELFVAGRIKDLIIINGLNHYPQDIERTLEQCHAALAPNACAAFSVEVNGEERLVAACEIQREHLRRLDSDQLAACIRQAVAEEHELDIHALLFLKPLGMPRTSSGKIQRHVCRAAYLGGDRLDVVAEWRTGAKAETASEACPSDTSADKASIQRWLRDRVAAKLGISPTVVDVREPFTRYGLESRDAIAISGELQEWLGSDLPPTLVYDYPNIEALAAHLVRENVTERRSLTSASTSGQVAIIGIGCRFPGADSPENYWKLMAEGREAIRPAPNRNGLSQTSSGNAAGGDWGGYLDSVDLFEPEFFGISGREAELMDPQQRLLAEVAWEALEYAGISPHDLAGSDTAVMVGISNLDYSRLHPNGTSAIDPYIATGNALSIAANRLSYLLDLRGPSWAVDTACSSSLVAVHQACQSLLAGECELALAGGVNLILTPQLSAAFSNAGMLSPDGSCKTFDADANGYVRGEGVGLVVLKRIEDAERDGDHVLAVIRGSAVNQDGRSNGLTAPNGPAQQAAIRQALRAAGAGAHEISYVEAHGTGTPLGDPIEMNSLVAVLHEGRRQGETCWVGSVKTNIGHLESAAGIAGLIKVVMALMNEAIPPHLQLRRLNSHIALDGTAIQIPTTLQPWRRGKKRLAGVSSFGFGGTNAHVIVEEGPAPAVEQSEAAWSVEVLALSARTSSALQTLSGAYAGFLRSHPEVSLSDFAYTANAGRSHFPFRLAVVAGDAAEAIARLERHRGSTNRARVPKIAFLFTGQGSQYRGMGRQLFDSHAGFRQTLERCDELLRDYLPKPLLEVLFGSGPEIDETAYAQPALFALEYALAEVWKQWGVVPSAVLGHSVGEYAAACFAGVFSLEDGLHMIAERGRLMQALPQIGAMLSVFAGQETCVEVMRPDSDLVNIAAVNGPAHVVLSGDSTAIGRIESTLVGRGIGVKRLNVSHAFHSPLMKPMVEQFGRVTTGVEYRKATTDTVSCVTGLKANGEISTPDYWRDQVLAEVRFGKSMESLAAMGIDAFVEIGPKPVLIAMAEECLNDPPCALLSSLEPSGQNWRSMFEALGKLYTLGAPVNWRGVYDHSKRRRISLPTYPFERESYWLEDEAQPFALTTALSANDHPLLGRRLGEMAHLPGTHIWESSLDGSAASLLEGHRLLGSTVAPYSAFVEMALAAAPQIYQRQFYQINDLALHHPLFVSKNNPRVIQVVLNELGDGNLSFKVFSRPARAASSKYEWTLCASAMIWATDGNEDYEFRTDVFCQQ